jgi:hypothetical protein
VFGVSCLAPARSAFFGSGDCPTLFRVWRDLKTQSGLDRSKPPENAVAIVLFATTPSRNAKVGDCPAAEVGRVRPGPLKTPSRHCLLGQRILPRLNLQR